MNSARKWIAVSGLLLTGALSMCGQNGPRGHWSGSIEVPEHPMAMEIDLDKAANGWIGSISIPAQNASGIRNSSDGAKIVRQHQFVSGG